MKLDRDKLIKWGSIIFLIALLPFAMELILVIDVFGLEFAASFAFLYLGMMRDRLLLRWYSFKQECATFFVFIATLYLFQPRTVISHSLASSILVAFTCSLLMAAAIWIPAIYLSTGFY